MELSPPQLHHWQILWEDRNGQQQQKLCRISTVGKSVILTAKNLLLHQAPLLAAWQSSTATVWLVDAVGSYLFAWHKDVPQRSADRRCQHAVSLLTTPAFCTWKCHSRGLDGLEKRCLTLSLCSTSVSLISFCVFLCVPQTTTRHCQRQNTTEKSITCLTSRPITCWHENAPFKNKKDKKKTCLSVSFQPEWNVTNEYFFPTLYSESTLGM